MPVRERQVHIPPILANEPAAARAWIIASAMPKAEREEVIAACKAVGIPASIAASQVQRHRYAQKQAAKAKQLPQRVRSLIVKAAESARNERGD